MHDALGLHDHQNPRRITPAIAGRFARLALGRMIRAVTPLFPRNPSRPIDLANYHSMLPTDRRTLPESRQRREPSALEILHGLDRTQCWRGPHGPGTTDRQRQCEHACTHDGQSPTS